MSRQTLGPFPGGVDNRRADHDLKLQGERGASSDLLRQAVNVDLDQDGKLKRRQGYTQRLAAGQPHSLWGDDRAGFYVDGTTLYHLTDTGAGLQRSAVRADLAPGREASFCQGGGTYYYTNGDVLGMVRNGERVDFTAPPLLTPALAPIAGALPPGRYQVCLTVVGPAGESASTVPQVIELPAPGGIRIAPVAAAPAGCETRIYMTAADGEVLARIDAPISAGAADIVAPPAMRSRCQTLLLQPMPAGSVVRWSNARLLVAVGNLLTYSEPFLPGLWNPSRNYIPFPAPITVVEPCAEGVYVAADKTYWLNGNIAQASLAEVLPYGGVPHSGGRDVADPSSCFWISERGLVRADGAGQVRNVQEPRLALWGGAAGATLLREQDGQKHVVASTREQMTTRSASGGFFDAEIIRKGVVVT